VGIIYLRLNDTYGKTNERRPLTYAVISSEENLRNLDQIKEAHLKNAGIGSGNQNSEIAIVWLSYNVHGNEASSTEAAMKTIYSLITEKKEWLQNTVIIMDPCVNPDGRDRYANWYNQVKTEPYNISQEATEHHEPWPGGRPNHYLFDLNRDWAWATQVETQQRLKIYNQWLPHIHVDFHEQGINDPYYFAPAAEPFHEVITPFQRDFQTRIGKNNAKYFDEEGWLYFTGERFDLLYPSYGDTYPTYMGAIGMTYEQAGHGRAGLGIKTDEGYILTLKDRLEHHYTTGLSTIEVASKNASELNEEFQNYFSDQDFEYKSYALNGNPDKLETLKELLNKHQIDYSYANTGKIKGYSFNKSGNGDLDSNENTLVVSTNQPKAKMVKVLFEPKTKLTDSLTYDITAWSLPYAYGLDAVASNKTISGSEKLKNQNIQNSENPNGAGYIAKWNSMQDAQFLADLIKKDIKVRFSEVSFKSNGQEFEPGSLIITKSDNLKTKNFDSKVIEIANHHRRQLLTTETSFAGSGPDFGSSEIKIINNQKIALLKGNEVSSLNFGEIWYFFEQDLKYPVTPLNTEYFIKVFMNPFFRLSLIKISRNSKDHIVWDIPFIIKILDILQGGILKIFQTSNNLPVIRMIFWVKVSVYHIKSMTVWAVIYSLSLFIFYNLFFLGQDGFCNRINKEAKFIGFGPDHFFKRITGNSLKIIGSVSASRSIGSGTTNSRT